MRYLVRESNGKIAGPYESRRLIELIEAGHISGDALVREEDGSSWVAAHMELGVESTPRAMTGRPVEDGGAGNYWAGLVSGFLCMLPALFALAIFSFAPKTRHGILMGSGLAVAFAILRMIIGSYTVFH